VKLHHLLTPTKYVNRVLVFLKFKYGERIKMKIVLKILGILLLLGSLYIFVTLATSDVGKGEEKYYQESVTKVNNLEAEWTKFRQPETEKALKVANESEQRWAKSVANRKQQKTIGFIVGGVASILGLGLLILGFVVGKKKNI
jgi:glucan phosphoethanolaminetransferase (alkaline phosphatase superfamily)